MATKTEVITAIGAFLTASVALGGFGYYLGRDTASSEVSQLTREIDWFKSAQGIENALDYLSELSAYNDNLFEFAAHQKEISEKNNEITELTDAVQSLEQGKQNLQVELEQATQDLRDSQAHVDILNNRLSVKYVVEESVSLTPGRSHRFLDGAVTLGLQSVLSNSAMVTLRNDTEFLDVGEAVEIRVEDARCMVVLRSSTFDNNSEFDLICRYHSD